MLIREHAKKTISLAIPISIGHLSHIMLGVIDSIMIGKVGAIPLAASALVNSVFILVLILGIGMSIAVTPLVAIAKGSENHDECGIILRQSLFVNLIFSIVLVSITFIAADYLYLLDQPYEVVEISKSYLRILSFSIIPFMVFQTYRQFIEGLGHTKPAMYINIAANFVNAFGNWLLIYGNLGFPRLELDGAGISSTLTRVFLALSIALYVLRSQKYREYDASLKFRGINFSIIKKIIRVGLPTSMQMFFEVGAFVFAAIMIGWIGAYELAAHQIAINLASVTFMTTAGLAGAVMIRVGHEYGKKDFFELKKAGSTGLFLGISIMGVFGLMFIILRNYLPLLYLSDNNVVPIASSLLIIAAFFQIFDGTQVVGLGILRGMVDVKIPMLMAFVAYWVICIPTGYLLGFKFGYGVEGVWIGLSIGLIFAAGFFTFRFYSGVKKKMTSQ